MRQVLTPPSRPQKSAEHDALAIIRVATRMSKMLNAEMDHRKWKQNVLPFRWQSFSSSFSFSTLAFFLVFFSSIALNAQIQADFQGIPPRCGSTFGEIRCISITGGTEPYNCQVNCGSCIHEGETWTNVLPNTYTVTITDFSDPPLTYTNSVLVLPDPFPTPLSIQETLVPSACNTSNGSICVVASGGSGTYGFSWQNNAQPGTVLSTGACVNNIAGGQYRVQVIDLISNCTKSWNIDLPSLSLSISSTTTATNCAGSDCAGNSFCSGSMTLVPTPANTGPYTITWSDGFVGTSLTRTGMCPGTYTATVTDANGCSASGTNSVVVQGVQLLPNSAPSQLNNAGTLNAVAGYPSGASTHFITTNTAWNSAFFGGLTTINTACNIVIMGGATLNISGLLLKMPQGSTIRVMPQGRLVAENSTFEPGCGTTWRGFEVFGVNATDAAGRGYLELNGCKVANASIGVTNFQFAANLAVPLPFNTSNSVATCGGRVKATNTQFVNNIVDVHLAQIALDELLGNSGEFTNCLFSIDQLPPNCDGVNYNFQAFDRGRVLLNFVQNALFTNCVFENLNPNNMGPLGAAWNFPALRTNSSSFTIDGTPSLSAANYTSAFRGFRRGLLSFGSYSPGFVPPFTIDRVTVNNTRFSCFNGMECNGLRRSVFNGNWLDDLPIGFTHLTNNTTTLTSRFMTQLNWAPAQTPTFVYEGNTHVNTQTDIACAGLLIVNGGPLTNYVVGNHFIGMTNAGGIGSGGLPDRASALIFAGRNRSGTVGTGVRYECNVFDGNLFDTFITWGGQSVPWSVIGPASVQKGSWQLSSQQLNTLVSAGNKFIQSSSLVNNDDITYTTAIDAQPFYGNGVCEYWYHTSELNTTNGINEMTPSYSWPLSVASIGGLANSCSYTPQISLIELSDQNAVVESFVNSKEQLQFLTSSLAPNEVSTTSTQEQVWSLYESLMAHSGELKDEILIALVEKLDFPTLLLLDVLSSEAGAGRTEKLLKAIENSGRSLSESDWNSIIQSKCLTSEKTTLETQIAEKKAYFDQSLLRLSEIDYSSWENSTLNGTSPSSSLPFIAACAADKLMAFGASIFSSYEEKIQAEFDLLSIPQTWQEYKDWQLFRNQVLQREDHFMTPQESEILKEYFYTDPTFNGMTAYILLNQFGAFEDVPYRFMLGQHESKSFKVAMLDEKEVQDFHLSPNPCSHYTSMFDENLVYCDATFQVRSISGQVVFSGKIQKGKPLFVYDTSSLEPGMYLLEIVFSNALSTSRTTKFIKQ